MAYQTNSNMSKDDWSKKEKRELFCKAINTLIMSGKDKDLFKALSLAKQIVDTAFDNYPDNTDGKGEKIEDIIS